MAGRSGSDTIVCELCGHLLIWDWELNRWIHEETGELECEGPEYKEHYR